MSPIFEYAADLYREMRAEWYVYLEAEYAQAEAGSGGAMLNVQGRRDAIDPFSLLTGPWSRVIRYAAPELIEWFESHGRPSPSQFEREWFTSWLGEMPEPDPTPCGDPENHSQPCSCTPRLVLGFDGAATASPEYHETVARFQEAARNGHVSYQHKADC